MAVKPLELVIAVVAAISIAVVVAIVVMRRRHAKTTKQRPEKSEEMMDMSRHRLKIADSGKKWTQKGV